MSKEEIDKIIIDYLMPYEPVMIALFGSRIRGDNRADSDLDILINLKGEYSLFDFVGMHSDLEEKLGFKVDLIPEKQLKKELRSYVLKDLKIIYEKK